MSTTKAERTAHKNQMIQEMDLEGETQLINTALTLLWAAFQAKKAGKNVAIYNSQNDSVEVLSIQALEQVKPTLRLV